MEDFWQMEITQRDLVAEKGESGRKRGETDRGREGRVIKSRRGKKLYVGVCR